MGYALEALIVRGAPGWPEPIARVGRPVPLHAPDAEFHGGTGFQAAVGWLDGAVAFRPRFTANRPEEADEHYEVVWGRRASGAMEAMAIDQALQFLGIEAVGDRDEFDIVGLGAHRFTEDW